jgi:hypothetical protein
MSDTTDLDAEAKRFRERWMAQGGDLSSTPPPDQARTLAELRRDLANVERQMMTPAERRAADVRQIHRDRELGLQWIRLEEGRATAGVTGAAAKAELKRVYDDQRAALQRETTRREAEATRLAGTASASRAAGLRHAAVGSTDTRRGDMGGGILRREMDRRRQDLEISRDVQLSASPDNAARIQETHRERLAELDRWARDHGEAWATHQAEQARSARDVERAGAMARRKADLVSQIVRLEAAEAASQNGNGAAS